MTTFEKTRLSQWAVERSVGLSASELNDRVNDLAAFALAQMEGKEGAEAERDEARRELALAEEWVLLSMGAHTAAALAPTDEHGDIHRTLIAAQAVRRALSRNAKPKEKEE